MILLNKTSWTKCTFSFTNNKHYITYITMVLRIFLWILSLPSNSILSGNFFYWLYYKYILQYIFLSSPIQRIQTLSMRTIISIIILLLVLLVYASGSLVLSAAMNGLSFCRSIIMSPMWTFPCFSITGQSTLSAWASTVRWIIVRLFKFLRLRNQLVRVVCVLVLIDRLKRVWFILQVILRD